MLKIKLSESAIMLVIVLGAIGLSATFAELSAAGHHPLEQISIEGLRPWCTRLDLEGKLGATSSKLDGRETWTIGGSGQKQTVQFFRDGANYHLVGSRLMLNGEIVCYGWGDYGSLSRAMKQSPHAFELRSRQKQVEGLLGPAEHPASTDALVYSGKRGPDSYQLIVHLLNYPFDPKNRAILNFELVWR